MSGRRWLAACMLLVLGGATLSCLGCGRYGPPRRGDRPPATAGAPTPQNPQPPGPQPLDPDDERDPRRPPRR